MSSIINRKLHWMHDRIYPLQRYYDLIYASRRNEFDKNHPALARRLQLIGKDVASITTVEYATDLASYLVVAEKWQRRLEALDDIDVECRASGIILTIPSRDPEMHPRTRYRTLMLTHRVITGVCDPPSQPIVDQLMAYVRPRLTDLGSITTGGVAARTTNMDDRIDYMILDIVNYLLTTKYSVSRVDREAMLAAVERCKQTILKARAMPEMLTYSSPQNILTRHGLFPATLHHELSLLLSVLFGGKTKNHRDMYNKHISDKANLLKLPVSVVIIDSTAISALEFDLRGVIDSKYIAKHGLNTSDSAGLNKKILTKMRTVADVRPPTDTRITTARMPVLVKIEPAADTCLVFETIAENKWRLLGVPTVLAGASTVPNVNANANSNNSDVADSNILFSNMKIHLTPPEVAVFSNGPLSSPIAYNQYCERLVATKFIDESYKVVVDKYAAATAAGADASAKLKIRNAILEYLEAFVDKSNSKHSSMTKSAVSVDENTIIADITEILVEFLPMNEPRGALAYREQCITRLCALDDIANTLYKRLRTAGLFVTVTPAGVDAVIDNLDKVSKWIATEVSLKEYYLSHKY